MTNKQPPTIKGIEREFDKEIGEFLFSTGMDSVASGDIKQFYRHQIEEILKYLWIEKGLLYEHVKKRAQKEEVYIRKDLIKRWDDVSHNNFRLFEWLNSFIKQNFEDGGICGVNKAIDELRAKIKEIRGEK